jgi:hypothetical protein
VLGQRKANLANVSQSSSRGSPHEAKTALTYTDREEMGAGAFLFIVPMRLYQKKGKFYAQAKTMVINANRYPPEPYDHHHKLRSGGALTNHNGAYADGRSTSGSYAGAGNAR